MDMHATTEEMLEMVFSKQSIPRLYDADQQNKSVSWESTVEVQLWDVDSWEQCKQKTFWELPPSNDYVKTQLTGKT
jgi:hypothetical protein